MCCYLLHGMKVVCHAGDKASRCHGPVLPRLQKGSNFKQIYECTTWTMFSVPLNSVLYASVDSFSLFYNPWEETEALKVLIKLIQVLLNWFLDRKVLDCERWLTWSMCVFFSLIKLMHIGLLTWKFFFFPFYQFQEKILCRVCFEEQIDTVLLPCRHHILCRYILRLPAVNNFLFLMESSFFSYQEKIS